jgi:OPT family small oligopeptide transporter
MYLLSHSALLLTCTRIKPNNVVVNQLFGGFTGLSLIPLTFDWTYVSSYLQDPLLAPAHAHINTLIGLFIFVIITTLGVSFTNTWYGDYLPINTSTTFDNTQSAYNVTRILGPNYTFDLAKYKQYSPMFLAPTFALNYGLSFAALTAALVHTAIFHGKEIIYRLKAGRSQEPDIHLKLILKYAPCPDWWYGILLVLSIVLGLGTVLGYDSQLPWWAYFVSLLVAFVFTVPACLIYGLTNIQLSLNVISPFLAGYMIPGRPIGVMIFKVYSTIIVGQAQYFSGDLKLAHYMKVPPRTAFTAQIVAAIWGSIVQIAVMNWTLGNIPDVCSRLQTGHFTCPNGRAFFSNSITWGVIGPHRMFGPGSIYSAIHYYWLVGAALPIIFYFLMRAAPKSPLRYLNAPVMLGAMAWLPPASPLSFSSWAIFGLVFNFWIMRRWPGWWDRYNYLTAAGLDSGLIISTVVIFFAITFKDYPLPNWWGNVKPYETMVCVFQSPSGRGADLLQDYLNTAMRKTVAEGETFGPKSW